MKTLGLLYTAPNGQQEIVVSRARHDYHSSTDGCVSVDGGQCNYNKVCYDKDAVFKWIWFEYHNVTYADLYNDWNYRKNELGNIWCPSPRVTILDEKDYPDTESFDWKVETAMWKTSVYNEGVGKMIMLKDATDAHLRAILENCSHISDDTKKIINHILESRE